MTKEYLGKWIDFKEKNSLGGFGMDRKYFDDTIEIDFEMPEQIKKDVEGLIRERKKDTFDVEFYEEDLISDCNQAFNDGLLTLEQVKTIRAKYL